jgi:hypothetical protein
MNKRLSSVLFIKKADNNKIEGLKEYVPRQEYREPTEADF